MIPTNWAISGSKRLLIYLGIFLGVILFLVCLVFLLLYFFQDRLLYMPSQYSMQELREELANAVADAKNDRDGQSVKLVLWPSETNYRGILAEVPTPAPAVGTVLIFHGNAGSAANRLYYVPPLWNSGLRVILMEYPGYGPRAGLLNEKNITNDAVDSLEQVITQFGQPVYVAGESLGCGVACAVIGRAPEKVAGALLITPWDNLVNVAQTHYPQLPVRYLARDRYDSVHNLKNFSKPVALVIALQDEIIPPTLAENLYTQYKGPKLRLTVPGGHNGWINRVDARWWREIWEFVSQAR